MLVSLLFVEYFGADSGSVGHTANLFCLFSLKNFDTSKLMLPAVFQRYISESHALVKLAPASICRLECAVATVSASQALHALEEELQPAWTGLAVHTHRHTHRREHHQRNIHAEESRGEEERKEKHLACYVMKGRHCSTCGSECCLFVECEATVLCRLAKDR